MFVKKKKEKKKKKKTWSMSAWDRSSSSSNRSSSGRGPASPLEGASGSVCGVGGLPARAEEDVGLRADEVRQQQRC